ncbi:hypothetical protein EC844_103150 [Acinetobacter calcoaceticus]|uniref:Uncharacterized protein n=1 Tax=Acinetobacter calcoaceticus TaxID=471 RepID=A0A4R1Y972_ACICA|nr:hypothetical protein EC844_103150 [Acinetobacter calcoaceticus]
MKKQQTHSLMEMISYTSIDFTLDILLIGLALLWLAYIVLGWSGLMLVSALSLGGYMLYQYANRSDHP